MPQNSSRVYQNINEREEISDLLHVNNENLTKSPSLSFSDSPPPSLGGENKEPQITNTSNTEGTDECVKGNENTITLLNSIRAKNPNKPIIGQININFLEKKFEPLQLLVKDIVDILMVSETKLDSSFPSAQFELKGFSEPFRLDRNCFGGGIMIYVREHIPCRRITTNEFPKKC